MNKEQTYDLIIIGFGQSALACAYYLRRTNIKYLILDAQENCGGAWLHTWDSLSLFSPAAHSSLPGWLMPKSENPFPTRQQVISYLCEYEKRYKIQIERPVEVSEVIKEDGQFKIVTDSGNYYAQAIISSTGTFGKPYIPKIAGINKFKGQQIHSARYRNPEAFTGKKVLIVGEGNSGAQILAEVSKVAEAVWATRKKPEYLPDDVDGRVLFDVATAKYYAEKKGEKLDMSKYNLGNIVMVPAVKEARSRDVIHSREAFVGLYEEGVIWQNGEKEAFEAIIWCTGFGFSTGHLKNLVEVDERGKVKTKATKAIEAAGIWLVGYGGWTGFASATIIGVGRSARDTIKEVEEYLKKILPISC